MPLLPLRLSPGTDLRRALEALPGSHGTDSAFVVAGIGSLVQVGLRYADATETTLLAGPLEMLSLSGSLGAAGAHLHVSVSDASGRVFGGHLGLGSTVRTTAEVLLALLPPGTLTREHDAATGFNELVVRSGRGMP
ncbi:PPC domain-containing DNA-binding protein [Hydrogenophaga sp. PBL-H3]|uniref:PPC domain-containing DNA-binding protein n=1 Tax=Hydrogenophaga sp. PBL-H3 TaxID=434010 RepID=UPI00131FE535|nr:PPC domain-containing DNA-binding protein [Hydrogenophaga sp. PBL-H3]QHE75347.1 DNA-binding protein [Hydrogenophaga sp. PBL-H3]QHE79774.1 DNA-binding protein [Hydrogenophaga sp. PBL-H3]